MLSLNYLEAAVFSDSAYHAVSNIDKILSSSWKQEKVFQDKHGLGIAVFSNAERNLTVISFRGTKRDQENFGKNLFSDSQLLCGISPSTTENANQFIEREREKFHTNVILTGHSLGGALATLMALRFEFEAVVFDCPGCYRIASSEPNMHKHKELIITVLGRPNLINTCDKHVGVLQFVDTSAVHEMVSNSIRTGNRLLSDTAVLQSISGDSSGGQSLLHGELASYFNIPIVADAQRVTSITASTLSLYSTIELHGIKHFIHYFQHISASPSYIKKWPNWLNHISKPTTIPVVILEIEMHDHPVLMVDNSETNQLIASASVQTHRCMGSSLNFLPQESISNKHEMQTRGTLTVKKNDGDLPQDSTAKAVDDNASPNEFSQVNPAFNYDAEEWIVSILNTGEKRGGHAVIVVEGLKTADTSSVSMQFSAYLEKFVGQYDIFAAPDDTLTSSFNLKGHICNVECKEDKSVTRAGGYQQFSSKSYKVDAKNALKMIASIKVDHEACEQAKRGEREYPKYQYLGTDHPLIQLVGSVEDGHSCASWCARKLEIATGGKHNGAKPKVIANQCLIL